MNLATVEKVVAVEHHPNADKLDIIKVLGYDAIVGRDQYKVGDLVVFIQPDSILPADRAWASTFLRYTSKGRVRAVRLRGEWSMGLVLSEKDIALELDRAALDGDYTDYFASARVEEVTDITELLGVTKYEPALPNNLQARGGLPFQIPKTDEDRWQNLRNLDSLMGQEVDVTLKIDGSSATYYCLLGGHWPGEDQTKLGLCSRSLELKMGADDNGQEFNSKWHEAEKRYGILARLRDYCEREGVSLALRGEIYGEGIQAFPHNPHGRGPIDFAAYSVYNIADRRYEEKDSKYYYRNVAASLGLPEVPVLEHAQTLTTTMIADYDHKHKTVMGQYFEGVVIKHSEGSFKVINKWYDSEKE